MASSEKQAAPAKAVYRDLPSAYSSITARDPSGFGPLPPLSLENVKKNIKSSTSPLSLAQSSPNLPNSSPIPVVLTTRRSFWAGRRRSLAAKQTRTASKKSEVSASLTSEHSSNLTSPPVGDPEIPEHELGTKFPTLASPIDSPDRPEIKAHHFSNAKWAEYLKNKAFKESQADDPDLSTGSPKLRRKKVNDNLQAAAARPVHVDINNFNETLVKPTFTEFLQAASQLNDLGETSSETNEAIASSPANPHPPAFHAETLRILESNSPTSIKNNHSDPVDSDSYHGNVEDARIFDLRSNIRPRADGTIRRVVRTYGNNGDAGWIEDLTESRGMEIDLGGVNGSNAYDGDTTKPHNVEFMGDSSQAPERFDSNIDEIAWSPRGSEDSQFEQQLDHLPSLAYNPNDHISSKPPNTPLPPGPPTRVDHQDLLERREDSSKWNSGKEPSRSSESYGNTRNLLDLSCPKLPAINFGNTCTADLVHLPSPLSFLKLQCDNSNEKSSSGRLTSSRYGLSSTGRGISNKSFGRLSFVSSDGSIHSQNLSSAQMSSLEQQINEHLRSASAVSSNEYHSSRVSPHHANFEHKGRVSIEYNDDNEDNLADVGPGSSQRSTSSGMESMLGSPVINAPMPERQARLGFHKGGSGVVLRKGTPPLLFGKNNIMSNADPGELLTKSMLDGATIREPRVKPTSEKEKHAWMTEDDKNEPLNFNHFGGYGRMGRMGTGSSLADNSDSPSLSPPKFVEQLSHRTPVIKHPAHPRYAHTYNLLKDRISGEVVLVPEYPFASRSGFPHQNARTGEVVSRILNNPYQHPTPLNKEHAHPFASSPPQMSSERRKPRAYNVPSLAENTNMQKELNRSARPSGFYTNLDRELHDTYEVDERRGEVVKDGQRDVSYASLNANASSAWLSTVDEAPLDEGSHLPIHGNSFAKLTVLGPKANVTGTPEGGGTRKVGSSLADASSPDIKLSSSPTQLPSSPPGLLSSAEKASASQSANLTTPLRAFYRRTIDGSAESTKTHVPGGIYEQIRNHKLNRDSIFSSDSEDEFDHITPIKSNISPTDVDAHRQHLIDHDLLPRDPTPPPAPRRHSAPFESIELKEIPKGSSNVVGYSLLAGNVSPGGASSRMRGIGARPRVRGAVRLDIDEMQQRVTEGGVIEDVSNISSTNPDNGKNKKSKDRTSKQIQTNVSQVGRGQGSAQSLQEWVENRAPTDLGYYGRVYQPTTRPSSVQYGVLPTRVSANSPVSHVRSPHLYRIPRPATAAVLTRQKELSRLILALSCLLPPLLLAYGHGYLDQLMNELTHGECTGLRDAEKKLALAMGYTLLGGCIVGLVVAGVFTGK
ncbi:hypothetical protein MMC06_003958 [Schaereria dolodes]|nr:hypothetical protein [Schaereria dolodes]